MRRSWAREDLPVGQGHASIICSMKRDEFSKPTIEKLRARVANRCSNPECRVPTTAAAGSSDKVNNIGVAAHITAAAPGGPRYSDSMSQKQRKSIENAIWLCSSCSTAIDRDVERYPVSVLQEWKKQAEQAAKNELGKKLPQTEDAVDTVTMALTGAPKKVLVSAIENTHKATQQALSNLDPRFRVITSHSNGTTTFELHAEEDVDLQMSVRAESVQEFFERYKSLASHGEDLVIDAASISFAGSKLLEELPGFFGAGRLNITSERKPAVTAVTLVEKGAGLSENFPDVAGEVRYGTESMTFEGSSCGGLLRFFYTVHYDRSRGSLTINTDLESWDGQDVDRLPYFSKLQQFFGRLERGWVLGLRLDIEGLEVFSGNMPEVHFGHEQDEMTEYFRYIDATAVVSRFLSVPIRFDRKYLPTRDEYQQVLEAASVVRREISYTRDQITGPIVSPLELNENCENLRLLTESEQLGVVRFVENNGQVLKCLGQSLRFPPKVTYLTNVTPQIDVAPSEIRAGQTIPVEWVPKEGFQIYVEYLEPNN